jgi:4-methylaminobutanoate oxidase (formaldehyde-forming)
MEEDTPLEAGLSFASDFNKAGGFIVKKALLKQKAEGVKKRMVLFKFLDSDATSYHEEPIFRNGEIVSRTTSGMYGHFIGGNLAVGYACNDAGVSADWVKEGKYEIKVATQKYKIEASLRAFYDPEITNIKC